MTAQKVAWSSIAVGDLVLGAKDGKEWRVAAIGDGKVTLHRTEPVRTVEIDLPMGTVVRLATAAEVTQRAVAVAQVILGGEVISIKDNGDERGHRCPATYIQPASLASHLLLFHGAPDVAQSVGPWGSGLTSLEDANLTMGQLVALHAHFHDHPDEAPTGTVKHWHDPAWTGAVA